MFTAELTLKPIPPFSFQLSAQIFSDGDGQIRIYEDGKFRQIIRVDDKLILATLKSVGTVDNPKLKAELKSSSEISYINTEEASEKIVRLFNLELDLLPFYDLVENDKILKRITEKLRGLHSPSTQTVYEALMDSIVEQQISLKVATAMERRMIKKFGEAVSLEGEIYYAYPKAEMLAHVNSESFGGCGLSGRKVEYVKEISALVAEGKLIWRSFEATRMLRTLLRSSTRLEALAPGRLSLLLSVRCRNGTLCPLTTSG